jgi:putative ABC transport system substrate-binding protein
VVAWWTKEDVVPAERVKRREFITLLGGAAATWPLATRAQQSAMQVIGFVDSGSQVANTHLVAAFRQGLSETGYVDRQNVIIQYRWANGEYDRLPVLAAELVRIPVAVLATGGGEPAARAARAATTTIPIVFDTARNPVELGWVASLNRPGGNMTGVNQMVEELASKELGLLHELIPQAHVIAMLVDPNFPTTEAIVKNAQTAMRALDCNLQVLTAVASSTAPANAAPDACDSTLVTATCRASVPAGAAHVSPQLP